MHEIKSWTNHLSSRRYVLDIGQSQDWLALQVALAPCLIGYGDIAKRLHADPKTKREGNIYWKWIENYVADDYTEAVRMGSGEWYLFSCDANSLRDEELLEKNAVLQSPSRIEELVKIFIHATKVRPICLTKRRRLEAKLFADGDGFLGHGSWQCLKVIMIW